MLCVFVLFCSFLFFLSPFFLLLRRILPAYFFSTRPMHVRDEEPGFFFNLLFFCLIRNIFFSKLILFYTCFIWVPILIFYQTKVLCFSPHHFVVVVCFLIFPHYDFCRNKNKWDKNLIWSLYIRSSIRVITLVSYRISFVILI